MADRSSSEGLTPRYLTTEQVSQLTGLSIKALETMRYKRIGPPFLRIGRRIRYLLSDIVAWLERERVACSS